MMEKNSQSNITKNAILKVILNIFNVIIPIITGPYLARTLNVELYGVYNKSLALVGFLLPFAGFGIYNYGIREISKVKNDKKKLSSLFTILFSVGCISSLVVLIFYIIYLNVVNVVDYRTVYYAMAIQILASMFNIEYMNEAYEDYSFIVYKTLLVRVLNVFLILMCVRKPDDILNYAIIYSSLQFINFFLSFLYIKLKVKVKFSEISFFEIKKIVKPLAIMFVLMNCNMLYTNLDKVFMSSSSSNGIYITYYTFSQTIINLVTSVLNSIILVTIPRLSLYIGMKNYDGYKNLVKKSTSIFFMLSIPLCFGFFIFSDVIMFIYGGSQYVSAGKTFAIFSLRMLIWLLDYVLVNQLLFVQGYEAKITKIYFVGGGLNIFFKIILISMGTLTSETAIFTTAIAELILIIIEIRTIKKWHVLKPTGMQRKYIKYFLCSLCFIPIGWCNFKFFNVEYIMNMQLFIYIIITILECVGVYFIELIVTKDDILEECIETIRNKYGKHYKYK